MIRLEGSFFDASLSKERNIDSLARYLQVQGLVVAERVLDKPWGAELIFDPQSKARFVRSLMPRYQVPELRRKMTTEKLLITAPPDDEEAPLKTLSPQFHARRSEVWRVLLGPMGVSLWDGDDLPNTHRIVLTGDNIEIPLGKKHQLIGSRNYSVMAECWVHEDPTSPSDKDDIKRRYEEDGKVIWR